MEYVPYILVGIAVVIIVAIFLLRLTTVFEWERGVKYVHGRFRQILEPGQHWFLPIITTIRKVDIRPTVLPVPGQEVLTSDGVTLKVSLAAKYAVEDPQAALNSIQSYQGALYIELQSALREIVGTVPIDQVLEGRNTFGERILSMTASKAAELGLKLHGVSVKDIMFPGALKQSFAQVVQARKEGEAALERARGETAALRNLANAAKSIENNPALMQLRLLQSVGGSTGNSLVLGLPPESLMGLKKKPQESPPPAKTAKKRKLSR